MVEDWREMSFSAIVQWWEEWQLRILAISSLLLQWFLFFSAASRKFQIRGWFRLFIWLSYLGADALAIYALATLFNRRNQPAAASKARTGSAASNSHGLEVLWAPVLLIHLAGQDTITAYNIEDNQLWTRHVITLVSQVTVSVYVFYKSWSGEKTQKRLLEAAIILFVSGILRCSEKPWALHRASINSLVSKSPAGSFLSAIREQRETRHKEMLTIAKRLVGDSFVECLKTFFPRTLQNKVEKDDGEGEDEQEGGSQLTLQAYIHAASHFFAAYKEGANSTEQGDQNCEEDHEEKEEKLKKALRHLPTEPRKLFVDLAFPYARRLLILQNFFQLDGLYANRVLQAGLSNTFDLLYTKERVFQTDYGAFVRTGGLILNLAALGLFCRSHKHDYDKKDAIVTYILLAGTAALETLAFFRLVCLDNNIVPRSSRILKRPPNNNPLTQFRDQQLKQVTEPIQRRFNIQAISWMMRYCRETPYDRFKSWLRRPRWSKTVAQYNLLDSFTRDTRPTILSKVARCFGYKDYHDQIRYVEHQPSSQGITDVVLEYVRRGWNEYIHDVATYKRFNNRRGQWTLQGYRQLRWSIQKPFDESVLLWHIATDLCFRYQPDQGTLITRTRCREMSNYMIYLHFVQPEMLLAGTRQHLFTAACSELEKLFENGNVDMSQAAPARQRSGPQADEIDRLHSLPGPGSFARFTTKQAEDRKLSSEIFGKAAGAPGTTIHNACRVGKALLQFGDEETMWEVMEGVWVEMLCYSASRCRGYLHAKSLGSGGEFLSYVWLLLSYMGMESLADRFQQPEPTEEEDDGEEDAVAAGPSTSQSQGAVYESEIHPV